MYYFALYVYIRDELAMDWMKDEMDRKVRALVRGHGDALKGGL